MRVKGVVFAELVGFLDQKGGPVFAEKVLAKADLDHGGAYTRIGLYPWEEAVRVVAAASQESGADFDELCQAFGQFLFERFTILYAEIIDRYPDAESLLTHVGGHIHGEVRGMYPDAEPPNIATRKSAEGLIVEYESYRPFAHIAHGLISGAMAHFGDNRKIAWRNVNPEGSRASFLISG